MPCSASKQDEDKDEGTYEEIPDCIDIKVTHKRNTNYKDECSEKNFNKKECMVRRDSIQSKYSTFRSTFSCQRFVR